MVVVSDTSVLIDLERGSLLTASFRLRCGFAVPDLLYERELKPFGGADLRKRGLRVEALDGSRVALALGYRRSHAGVSLPDTFALALAKSNAWMLLTGDAELRQLAEHELVDCHGILWVLDRLFEENVATEHTLHAGLQAISSHPRCRLPQIEVQRRLTAWKNRSGTTSGALSCVSRETRTRRT